MYIVSVRLQNNIVKTNFSLRLSAGSMFINYKMFIYCKRVRLWHFEYCLVKGIYVDSEWLFLFCILTEMRLCVMKDISQQSAYGVPARRLLEKLLGWEAFGSVYIHWC